MDELEQLRNRAKMMQLELRGIRGKIEMFQWHQHLATLSGTPIDYRDLVLITPEFQAEYLSHNPHFERDVPLGGKARIIEFIQERGGRWLVTLGFIHASVSVSTSVEMAQAMRAAYLAKETK